MTYPASTPASTPTNTNIATITPFMTIPPSPVCGFPASLHSQFTSYVTRRHRLAASGEPKAARPRPISDSSRDDHARLVDLSLSEVAPPSPPWTLHACERPNSLPSLTQR